MIDLAAKAESQYYDELEEMINFEPESSIATPSVGGPKRRYSELQTPKAERKDRQRLKSNEARPKLTTILETLNGSSLFPKIAKYRSIEQSQQRIKLPRLQHFQKDHKKTETTGERSASIETRHQTESIRTPDLGEKLSGSKITTEDRHQNSGDSNELQNIIYHRKKKSAKQTVNPQTSAILQTNNEQTQEDDEEYQKNALPGPGSYHYSYSCFENGKHYSTRSTDVSFMSKLTRFGNSEIIASSYIQEAPQKQILPPTKCQRQREKTLLARKRSRKMIPFNSKVQREESDLKIKERSPGPLDYSPRFSIEEDLIKKIQRHFKGSFDSAIPRFQTYDSNSQLGPGCYRLPSISNDLVNTNFYFKSKQPRFQ